jgi:hypothetical protein
VLTTDYELLMAHIRTLFPGATLEVHQDDGRTSWLKKLAEVLRTTPDETDEVTAKEIADRLGVSWKNLSSNVKKHQRFEAVLAGAGWTYVPNRGRSGAIFKRVRETPRQRSDQGEVLQ